MSDTKRILLVEDDPRDQELTLTVLAELGLREEVVALGDGAEAIDYLSRTGRWANRSQGHPAFVLLDLKMPRVDGKEVLRYVKSDPSLRSIPVVVFTSSREETDIIESYRLGGNAYVVKPVEFREFMEAIGQIEAFWSSTNVPPPVSSP